MKALLIAALATIAAGCSQSDGTAFFPKMPAGLEDCKVYNVQSEDQAKVVHVVRCPHSTTTTRDMSGGKAFHTTVIEQRRPCPQEGCKEL